MERMEQLAYLIETLLEENQYREKERSQGNPVGEEGRYQGDRYEAGGRQSGGRKMSGGAEWEMPPDEAGRRRLLRALMNVRPPRPLQEEFLRVQDEFLARESREKGIVDGMELSAVPDAPRLVLWRGDITRLKVGAIVNAANSELLGCFVPCHGCIDNAIHSAAGLELRQACFELMEAQGGPEPAGRAKITPGYNLPADYVLHTVGPVINGPLKKSDEELLASCYRSCLKLADERGLESVAFCCISTGVFHFPNERAAQIAVDTVKGCLANGSGLKRVVFNVFKEEDLTVYERLLGIS